MIEIAESKNERNVNHFFLYKFVSYRCVQNLFPAINLTGYCQDGNETPWNIRQ